MQKKKQKLEEIRDERIALLEEKIETLSFWQDIQDGDIATESPVQNTNSNGRSMLPARFIGPVEPTLPEPTSTKKEEKPKRTFPSDSNVYHFHPIAFVEQMKMITAPTTPPWLEIALEKAKMANGAHESQEPLFSFAKSCLELGGSTARPDDNDKGQWCGAFVGWCLNESNYKVGTQAWEILSSQRYVELADKGKFYKIIDEPVVGCIVVMTNYKKSDGKSKGSGHITFLYGINGNNLVCLGGNQGSHLKFSNYKRKGISYNAKKYEQRFNCFLMPINYPESNYNTNIPTITADQANKKYNINLETKKNESTH